MNPACAGKKRREASIDRLRDRQPAERWRLLQKMWRPFSDDEIGAPSNVGARPTSTQPDSPPPADSSAADHSPGEPSATPVSATQTGGIPLPDSGTQTEPLPVFVRPEPSPVAGDNTAKRMPGTSADLEPLPASVWIIDDVDSQTTTDMKRSVGDTVATSLQADDARIICDPEDSEQSGTEQRPKRITEILPFHDYIPQETREFYKEKAERDDVPEPTEAELRQLLCIDHPGSMSECPCYHALDEVGFEERAFAETYVAWEPSNLFSNPLYFEDAALERYGHTYGCVQPLFSLGKFSAQLIGLPYQMALHPVCEHRYALGWYRPGECAPYKCYLPPWNTKAAITAGAAYTGLIFLVP